MITDRGNLLFRYIIKYICIKITINAKIKFVTIIPLLCFVILSYIEILKFIFLQSLDNRNIRE